MSKIGDNAIDLPSANVIIQISSHFASRRQEAQRLGRILRPKQNNLEKYNAYYYSLVSADTRETYYSSKRQRFLVEQGYAFKVLDKLVSDDEPDLNYGTPELRKDLLQLVLAKDAKEGDIEKDQDFVTVEKETAQGRAAVRRATGSMAGMSGGGDGMLYGEYKVRREVKSAAGSKPRNALFRKREEAAKKARRQRDKQ